MHGGCDSPATMGTLVALAEAVLIVIAAQSDATRMTRNALDGVSSLRMSAGGVPGSE